MNFTWPINKKVTQGFNPAATRAWYKKNYGINGHNGLDFACPVGTPVYASADGTVILAGTRSGGSISIEINHGSCITTYDHLSKLAVKKGDVVKRDQLIGYSGNSGKSTGPHLHFSMKPLPNVPNGFWGCIDPTLWLQTTKQINAEIAALQAPVTAQLSAKDKVIADLNNQLAQVRKALTEAQNKPPEKIVEVVEKIVKEEVRVEVKEPLTPRRALAYLVDWVAEQISKLRKDK